MIPSDPSEREGQRVDEWAIVRQDGPREEITMRLESSTAFERAALVMPLPARATFALGHDAAFDDIAARTKPRVERKKRYVFGDDEDDEQGGAVARDDAAGAGGVQVVGSQDLGPLNVVTLRGDDARIVETWLSDHGFEPPEGLRDAAQRYLDEGWLLAAVRLRGAGGGAVQKLQPLVIRFPAEQLVYPMMSLGEGASATGVHNRAQARVDVIAPQPVAARNRGSDDVGVDDPTGEGRLYAGPLPAGRYLTSFRFSGDAEGDATFVRASRHDYRQVRVVYEDVDITGRVVGGVLGGLALIAAAVAVVLRRRRRLS